MTASLAHRARKSSSQKPKFTSPVPRQDKQSSLAHLSPLTHLFIHPSFHLLPAGGGDDGEKGPSDTDKICKQLLLDVVEFGTQLTKLGTDPARSEKFKELWSLVAPEGEKQAPVFLTA